METLMLDMDDELLDFEKHGTPPLPVSAREGFVENDGARIWHAVYGSGPAVVLLHGGLGHAGNWANQVPALVAAGRSVLVVDSRGHGRSTRDAGPFGYVRMANDVLAVMDHLNLDKVSLVGWSDGACTALILADLHPERVAGVFFFACNMDPSGTLDVQPSPLLDRCFARHRIDYRALSATPDEFDAFVADVSRMMQSEPNYTVDQLAGIRVPVTVAIGENDEFIRQEHMAYLARSIPAGQLVVLPDVSHFAPLQRPDLFNREVLRFLAGAG
jgi:pimeloyl-ACP methyl ester carboxylesterase